MIYIIFGLIVAALIVYLIFRQKKKPAGEEYFIVPEGMSKERVKKLGLDKASENVSYILNPSKLSFPKIDETPDDVEYKPDEEMDFVINIKSSGPHSFKKDDLWQMFDKDWRMNFGAAQIFGYSSEERRWTYVIAGGTPDLYDKVQVAITLLGIPDENHSFNDTKSLDRYIRELSKKMSNYPTKVELEFTETVEHAVSRGKKLLELRTGFGIDSIIILKSDKVYNGRLAWDALQSVGLVWGDGDLFHWSNNENYGHDQHFSVWTSTDPGYFFPENIKAGSMNPGDLIFGFVVPRSADPKNVFTAMLDAVKYCQSRLGGTIIAKDGGIFNEIKEKQELDDLIEKMKTEGLTPGSKRALRMF